MNSRIVLGAVAVSAALGLSAGVLASASAAGPTAPARWRVAFSHHYGGPGSLDGYWSIVAPGKSAAWAFGGRVDGGGKPTAARLIGGTWRPAEMVTAATGPVEVAGAVSPSDIWATTLGGYVLHWNGVSWRVARRFRLTATAFFITGITALSPTDVWVFGAGGPGIGTWHLHGSTWSRVTGPAADISHASALSAASIWGVTGRVSAGTLLHYNGSSWRPVRSGAFAGLAIGSVVPTSSRNVWALARNEAGDPWLLHLTGGKWTRIAVPARPGLPAEIFSDGAGGLWSLSLTTTGKKWIMHYSASGRWSSFAVGRVGGSGVSDLALVPGTTTMLGAGYTADKAAGNSAVWEYGGSA
jgi:hypothetical protein